MIQLALLLAVQWTEISGPTLDALKAELAQLKGEATGRPVQPTATPTPPPG